MKQTMNRSAKILLALLLSVACILSSSVFPASAEDLLISPAPGFRYEHDPRLNPKAMADIVVDPTAVYGFAPSPEGSLGSYAAFDWSDPELVNGENGRLARIAYHESINEMYAMMNAMALEGRSIEEIARAVSNKRNEIRLASYADDPEGLAAAKARNLEKYGHEEGPQPDELFEQYGSWETVLEKAFSANSGMDACLGLYDDYYALYIMAGQIEDEHTAAASREYAVTAFAEAVGLSLPAASGAFNEFADAQLVSPWFAEGVASAISAGVLKGYDDHTLRPGNTVSRVEAMVLLSRCLPELEAKGDAIAFTDVPGWAKGDIDRLSAAGLVAGYGDGTLGASDPLTVEQVKILAARLTTGNPQEAAAADYSDTANWAYYGIGEDKDADLFLICPTVDMNDEYHMALDDAETKASFLGALNMERGIYEDSTRMYAPYYRQAAMKVYGLDQTEWEPYMELAYSDVSAAFSYYLAHENNGRPIVLAGFSQGADMCYRLLEEYFDDKTLYDQLVAVYAIGWPLTEEMTKAYPQIAAAQSADDIGVVISFDCEAPEVTETFINPAGQKAISINPLNWKTDGTVADKSENRGACFTNYSGEISSETAELCGCYLDAERGVLKVTDIRPADYAPIVPGLPEGAYHVYDYQFFFLNLQENVAERLAAYLK